MGTVYFIQRGAIVLAQARSSLYLRWIGANALGELLGLGTTIVVAGLLLTRTAGLTGAGAVLLTLLVSAGSGAIEATVVGLAQWWALSPWFPAVRRKNWWLATLSGALLAYLLGYLPSTLMDLGAQAEAQAAPIAEPPQAVVLLLAAGLGVVAGAVLSFAQWLVLRRAAAHTRSWIPANMLAWVVGMPVIFRGIDAAQKGQPLWQSLLLMAFILLLAGALVGAIHGAFLVRMARSNAVLMTAFDNTGM